MARNVRLFVGAALVLVATCGLAGCGGASHRPDPVVAEVGHDTITQSALNHWMSTIVGGDYFEHLGKRAPDGLVSDPPNYAACVSAVERIGPAKAATVAATATRGQLESKCRLLYQAIKQQTLTFLISQIWSVDEDAEHGIEITNADIKREFEHYRTSNFPTEAAFVTYLSNHRWSLADELDLIRRDLLETRLEAFVAHSLGKAGSDSEAVTKKTIELYEQSVKRYTPRTDCRRGYLAPDCSAYKPPPHESVAPAPLLEQIVAMR
jgi:hypothetical protein